jgi:hypothetical protein
MRKLKTSTSKNLGFQREFNHLRVSNLQEFLKEYSNTLEFYASPYYILRELELRVMFKNNPDDFLLIDYKPNGGDGDVIFRLDGITIEDVYGGRRFVTYTYEGTVS